MYPWTVLFLLRGSSANTPPHLHILVVFPKLCPWSGSFLCLTRLLSDNNASLQLNKSHFICLFSTMVTGWEARQESVLKDWMFLVSSLGAFLPGGLLPSLPWRFSACLGHTPAEGRQQVCRGEASSWWGKSEWNHWRKEKKIEQLTLVKIGNNWPAL